MKTFMLSFFLFFSLFSFSQTPDAKRDNIWLFGYDNNPTNFDFGGTDIDFNMNPPNIQYTFRDMDFWTTCASICDKEGNLLFYTNGIFVANSEHNQMVNGDGLNPGSWTASYEETGYPAEQGTLILPKPNNENTYYLIHGVLDFATNPPSSFFSNLFYSVVDMNAHNGLGEIIKKNTLIIEDILDEGLITAVRHGNGRDWWIFVHEYDSNRYYRILLDANGIHLSEPQIVGDSVSSGLGQAVFSPDGSKYIRTDLVGGIGVADTINIYDFDRCTGLLSNQIKFSQGDSAFAGGVAVSPNSQFLYVSHYRYIFQYDLWASDIAASKDTVAIYDGFRNSFNIATTFFLAQLAPDGKIYINAPGGVEYLHVIHNPNEKGDACNVEQHGIELPTYNASTMPNFPNFRLGKWEGSPCDSLISSTEAVPREELEIYLYPNPASDFIWVNIQSERRVNVEFSLFNALGERVLSQTFSEAKEQEISLSGVESGIYFYTVEMEGVVRKSGKVIVQD